MPEDVYEYIPEPLRQFATPIAGLTIDPDKLRKHSREQLDDLKASLTEFGQRVLIIVQESTGIISKGNGTTMAALELGWTHVAALPCSDDDATRLAFAIADNRASEKGAWNDEALARHMELIADAAPHLLAVTGFDEDERSKMLAALEERPPAPEPPPPAEEQDDAPPPPSHVRMVQLFLTADSLPAFQQMVESLQASFATDNLTDTVVKAVQHAYNTVDSATTE
jgi:hypothetical protein